MQSSLIMDKDEEIVAYNFNVDKKKKKKKEREGVTKAR